MNFPIHSPVRLTPSAAARFPDLARQTGTVTIAAEPSSQVRFAAFWGWLPVGDLEGVG